MSQVSAARLFELMDQIKSGRITDEALKCFIENPERYTEDAVAPAKVTVPSRARARRRKQP